MGYIINCLTFVLGCIAGLIATYLFVEYGISSCVIYISGCIIWVILTWIFIKTRFANGMFDVNESDANKDIYKLTIDDFNKLHRRRYLLVRITRK